MDVLRQRPTKVVDKIAALRIIPPSQEFHLYVESFEGSFSLLNLDLEPTVGQSERPRVVEQDFHKMRNREMPKRRATMGLSCLEDEHFVGTRDVLNQNRGNGSILGQPFGGQMGRIAAWG
jgi:hypothetical protein